MLFSPPSGDTGTSDRACLVLMRIYEYHFPEQRFMRTRGAWERFKINHNLTTKGWTSYRKTTGKALPESADGTKLGSVCKRRGSSGFDRQICESFERSFFFH